MCGIAGFITKDIQKDEYIIREMIERISHRGPEGISCRYLDNVYMGHAMLSFVKTGKNEQPLIDDTNNLMICFNGEIYNYKLLIDNLYKLGCKFYNENDTEVIGNLYSIYGIKFVDYLEGMYSIAIYDANKKQIILARDRFGKKPLFYYELKDKIVFASELTALMKHPKISNKLNAKAIQEYCVFNSIPSPLTMYESVQKVHPGCLVVYSQEKCSTKCYWQFPYCKDKDKKENILDSCVRLEQSLESSVRCRISGLNMPFGVFLSGGLDSSLIASYARKEAGTKIKSFSIGFEDDSFDESKYARQVAEFLSLEHFEYNLSNFMLSEIIRNKLKLIDEPIADPSLIAMIALSEYTSKEVKIVLSGDGADELLMGYRFFQAVKLLHYFDKMPKFISMNFLNIINHLKASHENLSKRTIIILLKRSIGAPLYSKFYEATSAFRSLQLNSILSIDFNEHCEKIQSYNEIANYIKKYNITNIYEITQIAMIAFFFRMTILGKVDRASMLSGLEVRSPFLDQEFVTLCQSIPIKYKIKGMDTKHILKVIAKKYLPKNIVCRKKKGFRVPIAKLICAELKEFMLDYLSETSVKDYGIYNYVQVNKLIKAHLKKEKDNYRQLWSILCLQIWLKQNGGHL